MPELSIRVDFLIGLKSNEMAETLTITTATLLTRNS